MTNLSAIHRRRCDLVLHVRWTIPADRFVFPTSSDPGTLQIQDPGTLVGQSLTDGDSKKYTHSLFKERINSVTIDPSR